MGIEAVIKGQIESSTDSLVVQLDFILQQLNSQEPPADNEEDSDDEGDEDDEDVEEDDSEDLMMADASEGESLGDVPGVSQGRGRGSGWGCSGSKAGGGTVDLSLCKRARLTNNPACLVAAHFCVLGATAWRTYSRSVGSLQARCRLEK